MAIFLKISRLLNLFLSVSTYFLFMFLCECECHKFEQYICLSCVCTCLCGGGEREEDKREWASEREHADTCVYAEPSKEHEVSSHHSLPYALETKSLRIYGVWLESANPETLLFLLLPTLELWAKHTQSRAFNVGADCEFRTSCLCSKSFYFLSLCPVSCLNFQ